MTETNSLVKLLQKALELEIAAYLQYLSHAAVIKGQTSPGIIEQLKDNATDEAKHADILRDLIGNYLGYYPTTKSAETHEAILIPKVLATNISDENIAIAHYKKTLKYIEDNEGLGYYDTFWEAIRQILIEEEKHVIELEILKD